jgi:hypothetical protein
MLAGIIFMVIHLFNGTKDSCIAMENTSCYFQRGLTFFNSTDFIYVSNDGEERVHLTFSNNLQMKSKIVFNINVNPNGVNEENIASYTQQNNQSILCTEKYGCCIGNPCMINNFIYTWIQSSTGTVYEIINNRGQVLDITSTQNFTKLTYYLDGIFNNETFIIYPMT